MTNKKLDPRQRQLWAKQNKEFSLPVNGGIWAPDGTFVKLQEGVTRLFDECEGGSVGWSVKRLNNNRAISQDFKDNKCGHSWQGSLKEANESLSAFLKETSVKLKRGPKKDTKDKAALGFVKLPETRVPETKVQSIDALSLSLFSRK